MDIELDLQRAYDDGYKKGWEEAEAYALHCGDETPITNADRIRAMTDEELAKFLTKKMYARIAGDWKKWLDWLKKEAKEGEW